MDSKTIQVTLFLAGAFLLTRHFVITPHLIVLLLFANDFVTMSIATDHVTPNPLPEHWRFQQLFGMSASLATVLVVEAGLVLWLTTSGPLQQTPAQVSTIVFLMLVFSGQTTIYVVRERRAFWRSEPSRLMLVATCADVVAVSVLAIFGVLMTPVSISIVLLLLGVAVFFMLLLDALKLALYRIIRLPPGNGRLPSDPPLDVQITGDSRASA